MYMHNLCILAPAVLASSTDDEHRLVIGDSLSIASLMGDMTKQEKDGRMLSQPFELARKV